MLIIFKEEMQCFSEESKKKKDVNSFTVFNWIWKYTTQVSLAESKRIEPDSRFLLYMNLFVQKLYVLMDFVI